MPLNDAAFDALEQNLKEMLKDGLSETVQGIEQWIKEHHRWKDDTGSLTASVRGYVPGKDDPFKYFNDQRWRDAQQGITESRYIGRFPQNTPEHYMPFVESGDVGENDNTIVGIVTAFVEYGEDVENQLLIGGTFTEAQYDVANTELNKAFGKTRI